MEEITRLSRLKPTIGSPNDHAAFFRQAQDFADRFAAHEGVVGVLLTGGVARGYADHFSEIDLAVYLMSSAFEAWTRSGLAPYAEGDSCLDGWHVDFDYLCYEDELQAEWDQVKRWDRSHAVVLHDPQRLMRELLAVKAMLTNEEKRRLASRYLVLYGDYFLLFVVPSWLHRGDVLAAHHCLNIAFDSLIKAVFLANDELIPFDKWTLNLSYTLAWTPSNWRQRIEQALLVRETSISDVERRLTLLSNLLAECKARQFGAKEKGLGIIEAQKLEMLCVVREQGAMAASEFDRRFGLRRAIQSPQFQLLRRETRGDEEWLVFAEERFREYTEQGFEGFLQWDRALLRLLAEGGHR